MKVRINGREVDESVNRIEVVHYDYGNLAAWIVILLGLFALKVFFL